MPPQNTRLLINCKIKWVFSKSKGCGHLKRERLEFLANNPFYTKRFAYHVGRSCCQATIKDVAHEPNRDWDTIKTLGKQYIRAQLARAGRPRPKAIGIDKISIRKGHIYRIVVSDLIRGCPICFGGEYRKGASDTFIYWFRPNIHPEITPVGAIVATSSADARVS